MEDRTEIQAKYNELQDQIDFYLKQKEELEKDYIKKRGQLFALDDKLEKLTKQLIKLMTTRIY